MGLAGSLGGEDDCLTLSFLVKKPIVVGARGGGTCLA